jgi:hypothetical protein
VVREIPNQADVVWPKVVDDPSGPGRFFVHVREDRLLSPALEDHFLPVRRYILGRHFCPATTPPGPVAALAPEAGLLGDVLVARSGAMRFVDSIVADFVAAPGPRGVTGAPAAPAGEQPAIATAAAISRLDPAARDALRQKVHEEIAEARRREQIEPGAFVEVRRPH